jgi:flagellar export protein FliJ
MKKFKFSLQSVDKYKRTVEKLQMGELRRAREVMRELEERRDAFTRELETTEARRAEELDRGLAAEEFVAYDRYFYRLRSARTALAPRIARAAREVTEREAALVRTKNELKAYAKLRDEELSEWKGEAAAEDALVIGEYVSFNVSTPSDSR